MPMHLEAILAEGGKKIDGDEHKTKYKNQIQVTHHSFDVIHTRGGVPGTRLFHDAKPVVSTTFRVDKLPDSASPDLFGACVFGMIFQTVKLTVTKVINKKAVETEVYTLHNAVIANASTSSQGVDGDRVETLNFSFARIDIEHKKLDGTPVRATLDFLDGQ